MAIIDIRFVLAVGIVVPVGIAALVVIVLDVGIIAVVDIAALVVILLDVGVIVVVDIAVGAARYGKSQGQVHACSQNTLNMTEQARKQSSTDNVQIAHKEGLLMSHREASSGIWLAGGRNMKTCSTKRKEKKM